MILKYLKSNGLHHEYRSDTEVISFYYCGIRMYFFIVDDALWCLSHSEHVRSIDAGAYDENPVDEDCYAGDFSDTNELKNMSNATRKVIFGIFKWLLIVAAVIADLIMVAKAVMSKSSVSRLLMHNCSSLWRVIRQQHLQIAAESI